MKTNWDDKFIELVDFISKWSKDKSRGVGAIIVDSCNDILSIGYNGFPRGANDEIQERYNRPIKYKYTEHAERNAIFNAARKGVSLNNAKIYLNSFPCSDCCRVIIQSGIKEVICKKPDLNHKQWGEHFKISLELFNECNIKIIYL